MRRRDFAKYLGIGGLTSGIGSLKANPNFNFFDSQELNRLVVKHMNDPKILAKYPFVLKTPICNVIDDEFIGGHFKGKVFAADIVADDQESAVYESGVFEFESSRVPKLKTGKLIGEGSLTRINDLKLGKDKNGEKLKLLLGIRDYWAESIAKGLLTRINSLLAGMYMNKLAYSKLGVVINGSWQMPDDLALESTFTKPITDIKLLIDRGKKHKKNYDHLMLSSKSFIDLVSSSEFQNKSGISFPKEKNIKISEMIKDSKLNAAIKELTKLKIIEIYDGTFFERSNTGAHISTRVVPENVLILSSTKDHNNKEAADFGNGQVIEPVIASLLLNQIQDKCFGPYAYFTGNMNLNPPEMTVWGSMRGFPRRHDTALSATITIKNS